MPPDDPAIEDRAREAPEDARPAGARRHSLWSPRNPLNIAIAVIALAVAVVIIVSNQPDDSAETETGTDEPTPPGVDVAIVGDSLIEQSRDQFAAHADALGLTVETAAFGGSAPCDWLSTFRDLAESPPDVLIWSFAGNDSTPCINPGGGPPRDPQTIADAYAEQVPEILDLFAGSGTEVYVVQPPPVGEPASEPAAVAIRAMYSELVESYPSGPVADRPELTLVDPAPLLGPDRAFHRALPCEAWEQATCGADGTIVLREDDGIHLTPAGGERYARVLLAAIGHPAPG